MAHDTSSVKIEEESRESRISIEEMIIKEDYYEDQESQNIPSESSMNTISQYEENKVQYKRQKISHATDHNHSEKIFSDRNSINVLNDECLLRIFKYLYPHEIIKIERGM